MAAKKAPAKTAATKGSIAVWAPAFCNVCSKTIADGKQALRIKHLDYSNGKTTSYSWEHRGCWK